MKLMLFFYFLWSFSLGLSSKEKEENQESPQKLFLYFSSEQYGASNPNAKCFKEKPQGTFSSVALVSLSKDKSMKSLAADFSLPQNTPVYDSTGETLVAENITMLVTGPGTLKVDLNEALGTRARQAWSGSYPSGDSHAGFNCCNCWDWKKANGISGSVMSLWFGSKKDPEWRGTGTAACTEKLPFLCLAW